MGKSRDIEVDVLRSIGILLIILAHIKAPITPTVLRCFDVPLMVFVSGLCYSGKTLSGIQKFYSKRVLRLIVPTWLFLIFLFSFEFAIYRHLDADVVIKSFLLYQNGSIGYVWIIKVFLLIMLVTPFLIQIVNRSSKIAVYVILIGLIIAEEYVAKGLNTLQRENGGIILELVVETIPYLLGYSVFFILGLLTKSLRDAGESRQLLGIIFISLVVFGSWYFSNGDLVITNYKYPPQFIYIVYGCMMPVILWSMRRLFRLNERYDNMKTVERGLINALVFIGQNTLWIYLWHILFVLTANHFLPYWPIRYMFVLVLATTVMAVQYKFINKIKSKKQWPICDYFVG